MPDGPEEHDRIASFAEHALATAEEAIAFVRITQFTLAAWHVSGSAGFLREEGEENMLRRDIRMIATTRLLGGALHHLAGLRGECDVHFGIAFRDCSSWSPLFGSATLLHVQEKQAQQPTADQAGEDDEDAEPRDRTAHSQPT